MGLMGKVMRLQCKWRGVLKVVFMGRLFYSSGEVQGVRKVVCGGDWGCVSLSQVVGMPGL
jgi:hypothetical protein